MNTTNKPTEAQQRYLDSINSFHRERGYSPSAHELAGWMAVLPNAAFEMTKRLERKGFINIVRSPTNRIKSITITEGLAE